MWQNNRFVLFLSSLLFYVFSERSGEGLQPQEVRLCCQSSWVLFSLKCFSAFNDSPSSCFSEAMELGRYVSQTVLKVSSLLILVPSNHCRKRYFASFYFNKEIKSLSTDVLAYYLHQISSKASGLQWVMKKLTSLKGNVPLLQDCMHLSSKKPHYSGEQFWTTIADALELSIHLNKRSFQQSSLHVNIFHISFELYTSQHLSLSFSWGIKIK